jgi:putative hydrolase of the HAD superfamily
MRDSIEGVAFDLDGTLYPNYRLHYKLIPFLFKELRLLSAFGKTREILRKEQESLSRPPEGDFYQRQAAIVAGILSSTPDIIWEKIDRLIYKGWEPLFMKVKPYRGVKETITALRGAGYKIGLMSDFPPEIKLEHMGIRGLFDTALSSEWCGLVKPHPLPFMELASAMGLPPEKIIYVGNSYPYDIVGANRAGMKTAWIKSPLFSAGRRKPAPDFTFYDYRQLRNFMLN